MSTSLRSLLPVLCLLALCVCTVGEPKASGIGYMLRGYDMAFGNPRGTQSDPGYRNYVFLADYSAGNTTPDGRYSVPNGIEINQGFSCSAEFKSVYEAGAWSISWDFHQHVTVTYHEEKFDFKGDVDFHWVEGWSKKNKMRFIIAQANCQLYTANTNTYAGPELSPNFRNYAKTLNTTYDFRDWLRMYKEFGTHHVRKAAFGATMGVWSRLTDMNITHWRQVSWSVQAAAEYNADYTVGVTSLTEFQINMSSEFRRRVEEQKIFSVGYPFPKDGNTTTWINNIFESRDVAALMPINAGVHTNCDLFSILNFPGDPTVLAKKANCERALAYYCTHLQEEKQIGDCLDPVDPPDTPLGSYGGMYMVDQCTHKGWPNFRTGGYNCPRGYDPYPYGNVKANHSLCVSSLIQCVNKTGEDYFGVYGGAYQVDDDHKHGVINPMTGSLSCPANFTSIRFARVADALRLFGGSYLYLCMNYKPAILGQLGGIYTTFPKGVPGGFSNPFTMTQSCPFGYRPYQISSHWDPQHLVNVQSFICYMI